MCTGGLAIPEPRGLIIPDYTVMEEHSILVDGDVLVGNYAELEFGLIAKMVAAGEHVKINGNILSEDDVRIDMWSEITGDVRTKSDAYLGEFVKINGKLMVSGNLDVGNNVKISGGYEAKGWLVVRKQLPVMMFIFLYLVALLRISGEEEVEKALEELFSDDVSGNRVMSIPNRTKIGLEAIKTTSSAVIGSHCRLLGNIRARSVSMGKHVTLFGGIRAGGGIIAGSDCTIHGNLLAKEKVHIGRNCKILGNIIADKIAMHETSRVDGTLTANEVVAIERDDLEGLDDSEKRLFYGFMMLDDM